ncbi:MAG: GIY-YIG nuclease family protein [Myxococcaceae bacterium]|nr:GIY-YIG nuclease family protein [Myxococcaceae bacterium]
MLSFVVYMLHCVDGSFYIGQTDDLEVRLAQHRDRTFTDSYTDERLPVELVGFAEFPTRDEALARERQLKGWSRKKKIALIDADWARIKAYAKGRERDGRPSTAPVLSLSKGQGER